MKKTSSMSKDGNNLSKSRFSCYFRRSLVNFKNFIILFRNIWVIYGMWKSCCFWFGIEQKRFVIRDPKSLNSIPVIIIVIIIIIKIKIRFAWLWQNYKNYLVVSMFSDVIPGIWTKNAWVSSMNSWFETLYSIIMWLYTSHLIHFYHSILELKLHCQEKNSIQRLCGCLTWCQILVAFNSILLLNSASSAVLNLICHT